MAHEVDRCEGRPRNVFNERRVIKCKLKTREADACQTDFSMWRPQNEYNTHVINKCLNSVVLMMFLVTFVAILPFAIRAELTIGREHAVSGYVGSAAVLPCEVDLLSCGKIYVITWTKHEADEWKRVYLYSDTHSRPLGSLAGRANFILRNNSAEMHLHSLTVQDEGTYKCDVTYVQGKCPSLTFTKLFTLMTPKEPEIYVDGSPVNNASTLGPYIEGSTFAIDCRSTGGRPSPQVTLWNGTSLLPSKEAIKTEENGSSDVISTSRFVLSRWDLESRLLCRVENNATVTPLTKWVKLDIHVKPLSLRVRGPTTPVVAGEMVSLTCTVEGARPSATINWFNRSKEVDPQPVASHDLMSDSTYRTSSTLVFIASRYDHLGDFCCQGHNDVQRKRLEPSLLHAVTLDVLYPPAVTVRPSGSLTVTEAGQAVLSCSFRANPPNVTEVAWYRDGVLLSSPKTKTNTQLFLGTVSRRDAGYYACYVRNAFGRGNSTNTVFLDVLFPPNVSVSVIPEVAAEGTDAVLTCDPTDGNPRTLSAVRWLHNGEMMLESMNTELRMTNLSRTQGGNYACLGLNTAGWSDVSPHHVLDVHYPPGASSIKQSEKLAIKGKTATLTCSADDPGHPPASKYLWEFSTRPFNASESQTLKRQPVTAESQGIYFCAARNDVGTGPSGAFHLQVSAPPSFVKPLPSESGAPRNASTVRLMCHVECDPPCSVMWYRGDDSLEDSKFFVTEAIHLDEDPKRNVLKSVVSTLTWSLSQLPASSFDFSSFTCSSSANDLGAGVNSSTIFRIEYPPENIHVSLTFVDITEGEVPEDVSCTASAFPPGQYLWTMGDTILSRTHVLSFNTSITRDMAGNYSCNVRNPHGHARADLVIIVNHRPDCTVRKDYDEMRNAILICRSMAHPPVTNFTWFRDNTSISGDDFESRRHESSLVLPGVGNDYLAKFTCVSSNSLGNSDPCRLQLTSLPAPSGWVLQEENLIIVAGVAGGLLILMVLLVITTAVIAVRRRISAIDKSDMDERQSFEVRPPDGNLCSISPILPPPLERGSSPCVMLPLLSEMKSNGPHRGMISPMVQHPGKHTAKRLLHSKCSDVYKIREFGHVDHGNNAG